MTDSMTLKQFRTELEKAKVSFSAFMDQQALWDDKHYTIASKRPSSYFEAQLIVKEHAVASKRKDGILKRIASIEEENTQKLRRPESKVQEVAEDTDSLNESVNIELNPNK